MYWDIRLITFSFLHESDGTAMYLLSVDQSSHGVYQVEKDSLEHETYFILAVHSGFEIYSKIISFTFQEINVLCFSH